LAWKVDIDVAKIDGAIYHNSFCPDGIRNLTSEGRAQSEEDAKDLPKALYTLPSLFNHSCHPNSVWCCFGDVLVICAQETILPGTEITIPYENTKRHEY
jgi:SET domain